MKHRQPSLTVMYHPSGGLSREGRRIGDAATRQRFLSASIINDLLAGFTYFTSAHSPE